MCVPPQPRGRASPRTVFKAPGWEQWPQTGGGRPSSGLPQVRGGMQGGVPAQPGEGGVAVPQGVSPGCRGPQAVPPVPWVSVQ